MTVQALSTGAVAPPATAAYKITAAEKRFIGLHMLFALIALAIGSLFGPLQAFEHAGLDLYPYIAPLFKSYYQGLTLHGVLNALVFTTFFITGFFRRSDHGFSAKRSRMKRLFCP